MATNTLITLTGAGLVVGKQLDITVTVQATVEIDAAAAQRRVSGWLASQVGDRLIGGAPSLVIGERAVWRVPCLLTSATHGILGAVGTVDVDAVSAQILAHPSLIEDLTQHAQHLARSASATTE
ncbi:hypothetical protein FBQ82_02405 [Anaerolineae bacterium CFX7]|nr:hypothetical protein [Anaerolineae bacterium CFX7]